MDHCLSGLATPMKDEEDFTRETNLNTLPAVATATMRTCFSRRQLHRECLSIFVTAVWRKVGKSGARLKTKDKRHFLLCSTVERGIRPKKSLLVCVCVCVWVLRLGTACCVSLNRCGPWTSSGEKVWAYSAAAVALSYIPTTNMHKMCLLGTRGEETV